MDDLVELAVAVSADVAIGRAAKKYQWVRMLGVAVGLLGFIAVLALLAITVAYS